jgi:DNA repair ATPase RecN
VRHKLEIVEASSGLAKSIEAVVAFCGTLQCEVLSSSVTNETAVLSPSGSIAARVAPQDLNKFLDFVGKQGKIAQHATESEDKTAAIVDVEAKLKNQTDFRDSLRRMLTKPGVSVADLLQIQEKLAEAQAELDSEATQRKILANETEKVYVEIAFHAEQRTISRGAFASVGEALRDSGSVLGDSLAALITAIAAIIPWLIVIIPGLWFLIKTVRRFRERRRAAKAATPVA